MPLCITRGVFQLNETMFWYNDCVLKGFLPLHCRPPPTCGALHVLFPQKIKNKKIEWSRCPSLCPDSGYAGKSVHLRESCLGENCLRGECTQLLFLSVSIMWDLKLLYLVYSTVKITAAATSLLWKYLQKGSEEHLCSSKLAMCCDDACTCLSNQMPTLDGCSEMSLLCSLPLSN